MLAAVIVPGKEEEARISFLQEVAVMWYLFEEINIAKIIGYSEQPYIILMKFYPLGSLDVLLYKSQQVPVLASIRLSSLLAMQFAIDIARGLQAIHAAGFVHSDLKVSSLYLALTADTFQPHNILLESPATGGRIVCVITDFGFTNVLTRKALLVNEFQKSAVQGTSLCYAAPETLNSTRANASSSLPALQSVDQFSFGIIICELATRLAPWIAMKDPNEVIQRVCSGQRPFRLQEFEHVANTPLRDLISIVDLCWAQDPSARAPVSIILQNLEALIPKLNIKQYN